MKLSVSLLACLASTATSQTTTVATTAGVYNGFAFPYMDAGKVVFMGHKSSYAALTVYTTGSGRSTEIASTAEGFRYISAPFINKEGIVFLTSTTDYFESIFLEEAGTRTTIVNSNTKIPGSLINFFYLNNPTMNENMDVVFLGSTIRGGYGIFNKPRSGSVVQLLDEFTPIPNRPSSGFAVVSRPKSNNKDTLVFFGSAPPSTSLTGTGCTKFRRRRQSQSSDANPALVSSQPETMTSSSTHALHLEAGAYGDAPMCDANTLGTKASDLGIIEKENDNDYPRATPGLYFMKYSGAAGASNSTAGNTKASLNVIADWTTPAPECAGSGWGQRLKDQDQKSNIFTAFSDVSIKGDYAAFVAVTTAGTLGIYKRKLPTGSIECVVDNMSPIPGGGYYGDFPQMPSVHADGSMTFRAMATSDQSGMYSVSAQGKVNSVVTMGNKLAGGGPVYIGAGGHSYDGDNKQVAFYAVTDNTLDGIYVAPVVH